MKTTSALLLATANLVASHCTFQSFTTGGKSVSDSVRVPSDGNDPIKDVTSPQMVCKGGKAAAGFTSVAAGSQLTMQWHHNPGGAGNAGDPDEPIAASHKGPIMVYMAPAAGDGQGAVWTKIYESGYENGKWAVEDFIAAKGAINVKIPDLKSGQYLIRSEIIALHEADRQGGAQFYNGCGQLEVTGSGSATLPAQGTDMTKAYSANDPGVKVSIYGGSTSYKIPGPPVWSGQSYGGATQPAQNQTAQNQPAQNQPAQNQPAQNQPAKNDPGYPTNQGAALPKTFTVTQFIDWLKATTSTKARRHARSFFF